MGNHDPDMPELLPSVLEHTVSDRFSYPTAFALAFVGVGQGGGRVAETFHKLGYGRVAAVNTDHADLEGLSSEIPKLDLRTGGAGKDPAKGLAAAVGQKEAIFDLLTRAVGKAPDYILVCAGLGGGTGSGAVVPVIEVARQYMREHDRDPRRVGAIVTLPHHAEGQTPSRNAVRAFQQIHSLGVTPLLIIDNKRIGELFKSGVSSFYEVANTQVAKLLHLFNRLAATKSTISTFDRADFATLLDAGICVFGASVVSKYESAADISQAVREQLDKTVLAEVDLRRGKRAGCIFVGGPSITAAVPMDFFDGGFAMLTRMLADDSVVHRGIYEGTTEDLRCYTILAELPPPEGRLRRLAEEGRISTDGLDDYLQV